MANVVWDDEQPKAPTVQWDDPEPKPSWYQSVAGPVTKAIGAVAEPAIRHLTDPFVSLTRVLQEGSAKPLYSEPMQSPAGSARPASDALAEAAVPQTALEAGAMAGTLGAGPLIGAGAKAAVPGVRALGKIPALGRIFGGAVGGEVGNQAEGGAAGKGVALGGGMAALGELLGSQTLNLKMPGGRKAVNNADARNVATTMGEISAPLAGRKNATDLWQTAVHSGRADLGVAKEAVGRQLKDMTGDRLLYIPALGTRPMTFREAGRELSLIGKRAGDRASREIDRAADAALYGRVRAQLEAAVNKAQGVQSQVGSHTPIAALPPATGETVLPSSATGFAARPLSQREGIERTLEAAEANAMGTGYREGAQDVTMQARKVPFQQMRATPQPEPSTPLPLPRAAEVFDAGQSEYMKGRALVNLLAKANPFERGGGMLDVGTLQSYVRRPGNAMKLQDKLGPADFMKFLRAIRLDPRTLDRDILAAGKGRMLDPLRQVARGTNTGSFNVVQAPLRTAMPGIGDEYAGALPKITLDPQIQALFDILLQRTGGEALGGPR